MNTQHIVRSYDLDLNFLADKLAAAYSLGADVAKVAVVVTPTGIPNSQRCDRRASAKSS